MPVAYTDTLYDEANGPMDLSRPIPAAQVYVLKADGSPENLLDFGGNPLLQPVITDSFGRFGFKVPDPGSVYTIQCRYGGRLIRDGEVIIGSPANFQGASAYQVWLAAGNTGSVNDFFASIGVSVNGQFAA